MTILSQTVTESEWWELNENEASQFTEKLYLVEKNLLQAISDLRVHQVENFVTQKQFDDHKGDQKWFIGIAATVSAIFVTVLANVITWVRGG